MENSDYMKVGVGLQEIKQMENQYWRRYKCHAPTCNIAKGGFCGFLNLSAPHKIL
jgi:hypothetical protein